MRHIVVSSGLVTTLAGSPAVYGVADGTAALFSGPFDIDMDAVGSFAIVVCVRSGPHS